MKDKDPLTVYGHLMGKREDAPLAKTPPSHPIEYWEKKISWRIFVDGDISLGEFCGLLREAWADAYAKGVRDARKDEGERDAKR